jgi:hypothetical protein
MNLIRKEKKGIYEIFFFNVLNFRENFEEDTFNLLQEAIHKMKIQLDDD